jgi:hypothetical protein
VTWIFSVETLEEWRESDRWTVLWWRRSFGDENMSPQDDKARAKSARLRMTNLIFSGDGWEEWAYETEG